MITSMSVHDHDQTVTNPLALALILTLTGITVTEHRTKDWVPEHILGSWLGLWPGARVKTNRVRVKRGSIVVNQGKSLSEGAECAATCVMYSGTT